MSAPELAGKVAFVAGGSSGINLAIARRLSREGARVMLISRDAERLRSAAKLIANDGGEVAWAACDVRDSPGVAAALRTCVEQFGGLDLVISGAAGNFVAPATRLSPNGFRTVVDIDLVGTYHVAKHSYPFLTKPGASILSISAPMADRPMPGQAHVASAKAGINALTRSLALEWAAAGVRVNAISPGFIAETEGVARLIDTAEKAERLQRAIPAQRLGSKADVAELALFLCTARAEYITGAVIACDGGWSLAGPSVLDAAG
ncbi:SDR family oxidoreductase [Winogradskya humida]|uniref:NAD(P)-dependent dehydrogenase (Short-subunit alcohol dehydrogenase family) n=1 Tax=Winogradskya humida TaxID=113566 RepID=A0ABQ3ZWW5_9ACTN|nr:SDR family oxidoreductase [Actinoplanes humidus]GIE23043.1 hypothetical protein Ahu01nite_061450 [Actinoplanes humidus]